MILAAPLSGHAAQGEAGLGETSVGRPVAKSIHIEVAIVEGLLTLQALNAPLADVLIEIGRQAGIEIVLNGDFGSSITTAFSGEPPRRALERLLGDATFVMTYGPAHEAAGPPSLARLRAYGGSADDLATDELAADLSDAAFFARRAVTLDLPPEPENDGGLHQDLAALDRDDRRHAMQWLAGLEENDAIPALGRFLALDHDPAVRREAALALGDIGGEAASGALELGLGDRDPDVRFQVIEAIGKTAGIDNVLVLGGVLFGESDPEVRMSAVAGLGRARSEAALAFLEAAARDRHEKVREIANDILITWE